MEKDIVILIVCGLFFLIVSLGVFLVKNLFTKLSNIDPVTGLWNLKKFESEVQKELLRKEDTYYMISDTDFRNFKYINETYGKEAGNALLKESSRYLVKTMKKFDCYIARGFADHFYLLIKLPKNPEYYTYDVLKPYYDVKDIKKHFNVVIKQG
ncbi:MAG: diguanylate cyclase, partial [Treponema sp.]